MELNSLSISCDGSYFVVAGGSFKDKSYGFDLFALRKDAKSKSFGTKSLLHQRMPATTSLVTIDCIRLVDHSTLSKLK